MGNLEEISDKALEFAAKAQDSDSMLKALQASSAAYELREKRIESHGFREARGWANLLTPYTAVFALLVSLFTLASQSCQQQNAAERSQWREALKNLSLKDDSSALSSTFQMRSFLSSHQYGGHARAVAVTLLPYIGSEAGFDTVFSDLRTNTTASNEHDLVSIAQMVVNEDWDLYRQALKNGNKLPFVDFVGDPTRLIPDESEYLAGLGPPDPKQEVRVIDTTAVPDDEYAKDRRYHPLKRALLCSWKIDSISKGFERLWKTRSTHPAHAGTDLTGIVLENVNLSGVNFTRTQLNLMVFHKTNLTQADLSETTLDHTIFSEIKEFSNSKWKGANWWEADAMSCKLGRYLQANYAAPDDPAEAKANSEKLVTEACEREGREDASR